MPLEVSKKIHVEKIIKRRRNYILRIYLNFYWQGIPEEDHRSKADKIKKIRPSSNSTAYLNFCNNNIMTK